MNSKTTSKWASRLNNLVKIKSAKVLTAFVTTSVLLLSGAANALDKYDIELIETSTFTNGLYNEVNDGVINENTWGAAGDITSYNGYQYAIYYTATTNNNNRKVAVSRRQEGVGNAWETFTFDSYSFTSDLSDDNGNTDGHNYATIDIATHDGTIHVAFDHHVDNLHYSVSIPGVATNPENHNWDASLFSGVTNKLSGISVNSITYPQFTRNNQGQLYFFHREGLPDGGAPNMYVYSLNGSWVKRGRIINGLSGNGTWNGSSSRNPYMMNPVVDSNNRIHVGWTFREQGEDNIIGSTNHDIHYMYSDDKGVTWYNTAGTHIGTSNSNPVTLNSPGIVIHQVDQARSLLNQYQNIAVDNQNRPHMVYHFLPEELPDCTNVAGQSGPYYCPGAEYYHFVLEDGEWRVIPTKVDTNGAGLLWIDQDSNDVFLGGLWSGRVYTATAASGWTDWSKDKQFQDLNANDKNAWINNKEFVTMDEVARTVTRHKVINLFEERVIPVADGGLENPSAMLGGWGEAPLVWNDTGTGPYELAGFNVEGDFGGYLKNMGTISQDLNTTVYSGDTLIVNFYAGRNLDGKSSSGGGEVEASFIVDGTRYSMIADTTTLTPGSYQRFTHEVKITNSGSLSLEFKNAYNKPWIDDISNVTVIGEPPVMLPVSDGNFETPSSILGGWGEAPLSWNDLGTNPYEMTSFSADGNWGAYMKNLKVIYQDLATSVSVGDTLSVTFSAGRDTNGKNTSGGGVLQASFIIDGARVAMDIDTTQFSPGEYRTFTHSIPVTRAGNVVLQFRRLSGKPWMDNISDVSLREAP